MKSGIKDKEIKKRERTHKLLRLFYTEEYTKELEQKMESEERIENLKKDDLNRLLAMIIVIIIIAITIIANICYYKKLFKKDKEAISLNQYQEKREENDLEFYSDELSSYMIDKLNGVYLKVALTKLDDKVVYSLTYNYDILPSGYLHYKKYFVDEYITTILVNGYPYVSAQEMGLENDEEAYMATQLAVYEVVSRLNDSNISNRNFFIKYDSSK